MTKLFLIRFGQTPSPIVSNALAPHIVGKASALPIPGAVLSIFNTESSIEDVRASIEETGAFFILTDNAELVLPQPLMAEIEKVFPSGAQPVKEDKTLTMDDILDLITQNGIESLTPSQLQILRSGTV
jgi:hypothetical protein